MTQQRADEKPTVCHQDGSVSYWSVYEQRYRCRVWSVPAAELAMMNNDERERVETHIYEHWQDFLAGGGLGD
jgi:hypothetical protein